MGKSKLSKAEARRKRHFRIRLKISGTPERPRLCVHRSLKHIYAQLIDDTEGRILTSVSTLSKEAKDKNASGNNITSARIVGEAIAEKAAAIGIKEIIFDRGGYLFHGRVKALAEAAREKGLKF